MTFGGAQDFGDTVGEGTQTWPDWGKYYNVKELTSVLSPSDREQVVKHNRLGYEGAVWDAEREERIPRWRPLFRHNTREFHLANGDRLVVQCKTVIFRHNHDQSIFVNTGGFWSSTTRSRLNHLLGANPYNLSIYAEYWRWYIQYDAGEEANQVEGQDRPVSMHKCLVWSTRVRCLELSKYIPHLIKRKADYQKGVLGKDLTPSRTLLF